MAILYAHRTVDSRQMNSYNIIDGLEARMWTQFQVTFESPILSYSLDENNFNIEFQWSLELRGFFHFLEVMRHIPTETMDKQNKNQTELHLTHNILYIRHHRRCQRSIFMSFFSVIVVAVVVLVLMLAHCTWIFSRSRQ